MGRHGDRARRCAGQALVEFAFILPVTLVLLLGMYDVGRGYVFGVAAQHGAREAVRYGARGALDTSVTSGTVFGRFISASSPAMVGCALPAITYTTATYSCTDSYGHTWSLSMNTTSLSSGTQLTVTGSANVAMLTGFLTGAFGLGLGQITVQGQASMVVI